MPLTQAQKTKLVADAAAITADKAALAQDDAMLAADIAALKVPFSQALKNKLIADEAKIKADKDRLAAHAATLTADIAALVPDLVVAQTPPPVQAVVTFSAASMSAGAPITVNLAGGGGNPQDWLTITKVTDPLTAHGEWIFTPTKDFSWNTNLPAVIGQYEVRYFLNNSNVLAAKSAPFTVTAPYAAPVKSFPPTLAVAVGVPVSLLQYVSSALPLVFDPVDDADKTLTAAGVLTVKRVVAAGTVDTAYNDGH